MIRRRGSTIMASLLLIVVMAATATAAPWKFGVMSDTQWPNSPDSKNPNVAVNVIRHINTEFIKHGVKFVVQVGDLTDTPGANNLNLDLRATFAQDLYNAGIGFYPLRGNHESAGAAAIEFQRIFPQTQTGVNNQTPVNAMINNTIYGAQANTNGAFTVGGNFAGETGMEGLTYSFDVDNARFVLIDQFTKPSGTSHANLDQTDVDWVGGRLSSRPANTHAFSFAHKGLITENHNDNLFNSTNPTKTQASMDLMESFMRKLSDNGVRYHMGGHDHMHNRAIVSSPNTGNYKVQNLIGASNSYKFYIPPTPSTFATQTWRSLEKQIAQELFTVGYYIFTVDGPKVTVDYYAMPNGCNGDCDQTNDVIPYYDPVTGTGAPFTKHETFGYSLNGIEKVVDQGADYLLTDTTATAIANGETGYLGTTARILDGVNGSAGKDYNNRALTKVVDTGWSPKRGDTASDILTLWGMADSLATNFTDTNNPNYSYKYVVPNTTKTDTYVLSLTYDPTHVTASRLQSGHFGLATRDENGKWVNAITKNVGGSQKFVSGAWNAGYGLGAYGIDPATNTAWAVINHNGDFAVAPFPWSFGVMSDTQWPNSPDNKNPNVAVNVINHINQEFIDKKVKFVIQVGDLTDKPGTTAANPAIVTNLDVRATFTQALYDAGIGFYPLRGNHEDKPSRSGLTGLPANFDGSYAREFQRIFPQTQNGSHNLTPLDAFITTTFYGTPAAVTTPAFFAGNSFACLPTMEGLTYSFDYDNARFVLIDQFTKPDGTAHANLDAADVAWIGNQFASRSANTHAFSFAHKGLVTENHADNLFNSTNPTASQASKDLMETFMGYLQNNGVRYHMGGHDHMHNRAIVSSPNTGAYQVQNLIAASNSYKFYIPPYQDLYQTQTAFRSLEKPIAQELFTVGYYVFTVDGPKVTVDHYAMPNGCDGDCDQTTDVIPYAGNTPTANGKYANPVPFTRHDTFGYSLNGIEKIVDQGAGYALTDTTAKAISNGETGYLGTTAKILDGVNGGIGKDYNLRPLAKSVTTGWTPALAGLSSDVFTLWGMQDNLSTKLTPLNSASPAYTNYTYVVPDTVRTDTYTLSLTYDPATAPVAGVRNGGFGLAGRGAEGRWVNAVDMNIGGALKYVQRAWQPGDTLGTYGVDTATNSAWAVINHAGDFTVTAFADLSNLVKVTSSGFLYSRATRKYSGALTITNTGNLTIAGPLLITLNNLTAGVTLNNAGGSYNGYPQITVATATLNAGQSMTVPVTFTNSTNALIKFTPVTFQAQ